MVASLIEHESSQITEVEHIQTQPKAKPERTLLWILLIISAVGIFYLTTIRQGHAWGDDFSMYISHSRNIVEGRPYADTGYIYNPKKVVAPKTYPPVYPLILAPVYRLWGLNLTAMKMEVVVIFL